MGARRAQAGYLTGMTEPVRVQQLLITQEVVGAAGPAGPGGALGRLHLLGAARRQQRGAADGTGDRPERGGQAGRGDGGRDSAGRLARCTSRRLGVASETPASASVGSICSACHADLGSRARPRSARPLALERWVRLTLTWHRPWLSSKLMKKTADWPRVARFDLTSLLQRKRPRSARCDTLTPSAAS
jgi:hypothetical protein